MVRASTLMAAGAAALCAALALAPAAADAQGRDGGMMHHKHERGAGFSRLDANGDGTVSAEEFEDPAGARFAAADADGDGELTAEEMAAQAETMRVARRDARIARMIERLDSDGNGTLSLAEVESRRDRGAMFDRLDTDGDGALSREEMRAGHAAMRDRHHDR
ncbi:EF-hand domain-containing protein [Roseivivax isoporae]|nr:EF-hand domain-containing protein [Roseivivax isoporae]